jgi:hypothetical protein
VETRRAIDAGLQAVREIERAAMLSARMRGSNGTPTGLQP